MQLVGGSYPRGGHREAATAAGTTRIEDKTAHKEIPLATSVANGDTWPGCVAVHPVVAEVVEEPDLSAQGEGPLSG